MAQATPPLALFQADGTPAPEFEKRVENLQSGDRVLFSNGKEFVLGERLGCGTTTCIHALKDFPKLAIRIPKSLSRVNGEKCPEHLTHFIESGQQLLRHKVPIVPIYNSFLKGEYVIVEKLDLAFSLEDFLYDLKDLPRVTLEAATAELIKFARASRDFRRIGDFHKLQLQFTKQGQWKLLDWSSGNQLVAPGTTSGKEHFLNELLEDAIKNEDPRSPRMNWLKNLRKNIEKTIEAERKNDVRIKRIVGCGEKFRTLPSHF